VVAALLGRDHAYIQPRRVNWKNQFILPVSGSQEIALLV
jgi:hypothetical protein